MDERLEELKKKFQDKMNEVFEMWLDGALLEEGVQVEAEAANAALDFMRCVEMEGTN